MSYNMDMRTLLTRARPFVPTVLLCALFAAWGGPAWAQSLQNPRRVADGPPGQVLVSDRGGSVVAVDKVTLQPMWSFVLPNEGAPFGLATWNTLAFVGNTETGNVDVYRMLGTTGNTMRVRFETSLGNPPAGQPGPFENPVAIGVDHSSNLVFVLDSTAKMVKVFDVKGAFVREFAPVDSTGTVLSPVSLAVDETRHEVLVGDYGDPTGYFSSTTPARLLIYNYNGALQLQINGNGTTSVTTRFARIQGMATSPDGRIFATDPLGSRVLVLDRATGVTLGQIGVQGSAPGQLMLPLDALLDLKSGDLFVVNNRGARPLEVFRGVGQ